MTEGKKWENLTILEYRQSNVVYQRAGERMSLGAKEFPYFLGEFGERTLSEKFLPYLYLNRILGNINLNY